MNTGTKFRRPGARAEPRSIANRRPGAARRTAGSLHGELQRAARHRAPREQDGQARQGRRGAEHDERQRSSPRSTSPARRRTAGSGGGCSARPGTRRTGRAVRPRKQHAHELDGQLALRRRRSQARSPRSAPVSGNADQRRERDVVRPGARPRRRRHDPPVPVAAADSAAYTGMNDADSAPSPNRFCSRFGMRNAGVERVGRVGLQAEVVGEDAKPDQPGEPAAAGCPATATKTAPRASVAFVVVSQHPPHRACRSSASSGTS